MKVIMKVIDFEVSSKIIKRFTKGFVVADCGCWLWTKCCNPGGYGLIEINKVVLMTHRVSWYLRYGPIPEGAKLLHKCDTRNCVNPDHLFLGTNADNQHDKVAKGRQAKGVTQGSAKLTERQVRQIRKAEGTQIEIAKRFGVNQTLISAIKRRVIWKHI